MVSVIIKDNHEPKVIQLTYENMHKEIKDIPDSEVIVADDWFAPLHRIKNQYVCLVEPDCLLSSGYFSSLLGLFKKNAYFRRLAVLASATGVNQFGNRFFGYEVGNNYTDGILPVRVKKSTAPYPVQIAYIPGALLRVSMLKPLLQKLDLPNGAQSDLLYFSAQLSLAFWRSEGRVQINPNTTYVTTEGSVNDVGTFDPQAKDLVDMFGRECI